MSFLDKYYLWKFKTIPVPFFQSTDLRVSLKLTEKNVSYHFTRIPFMMGSHLCKHETIKLIYIDKQNFSG